jgi:hypothetical protein
MALNEDSVRDSGPVTAYFRDREAAELCLHELRNSGILNEEIGVSYADAVVVSTANYIGVQRSTDQGNSTSEIDTDFHEDAARQDLPGQPQPNEGRFDSEWEAKEYQHPDRGMVVSVSVDPARRERIRSIMQHYGARFTDWPQAA